MLVGDYSVGAWVLVRHGFDASASCRPLHPVDGVRGGTALPRQCRMYHGHACVCACRGRGSCTRWWPGASSPAIRVDASGSCAWSGATVENFAGVARGFLRPDVMV